MIKNSIILFVMFFNVAVFSQQKYDEYAGKYEEFDSISKPSVHSDLSKFIRRRIDKSLIEAIKFKQSDEYRKRIFLRFYFTKSGDMKVYVTSAYSELNERIKKVFKTYDVKELGVFDKNPLNSYLVQILSSENNQVIVNCSQNIVYDRLPVFSGCEQITTYNGVKKCINKKLETLIKDNVALEEIEKAKTFGRVELNPNFLIDRTGNLKDLMAKSPKSGLTAEIKRILELMPKPIKPPTRNGKPTHYFF